ncbi:MULTISPECIES: hypothetical protein [unclassified Paenibacillus]|uniref:hypothetical protein n=1 Tax=unclassified Paenibacillus TaxID=185978 RepID=UPI0024050E13|nr:MULTISPECIES: hypothetical protein [unclassified Paenibacillus]MDF9840145.1 hypothetical protein [Paenibacillus sp. PastF-2]MDF9846727.1 hypothetical protein [Paenibacillus sp. PastM-2]MDF9852924.1 hypothetical protein [Paenibacillus sp. PastF-1]MDH6478571.1 hypothetical protein [Paenibacillus sp. PastH-2]MDH6505931.1 hypothetical protein [Paenibacillus sp. PastM-3]
MADRIYALEELTRGILGKLSQADDIEITTFVEQREKLTDELVESFRCNPPSDDEKVEMRALLAHDQQLRQRMNELKLEASQWLLNRNQAKMQRNAYEAAYTPDSILMDRKK